jgi:putative transposase
MPNTYSQIYVQIVFAVKGRQCFIKESFREELQKYMAGIIANHKQKLFAIYCMPDHTHILVSMQPSISIADLVRDIKSSSSAYIKEKRWVNAGFSWQEGYGAFTYHKTQTKEVVHYILNHPEHHQRKTFREEYLEFLKEFEIEYNEKYLFEFYEG